MYLIYLNPDEIQSHLPDPFNALSHNHPAIHYEANPQTDSPIQRNSICRLTGKETGRVWLKDVGYSKPSQWTRSEYFKALRQRYLSNHETSVRTGWRKGLSLWCWNCFGPTICTEALRKAKPHRVIKNPTQQTNQINKPIFTWHESPGKAMHRTIIRQVYCHRWTYSWNHSSGTVPQRYERLCEWKLQQSAKVNRSRRSHWTCGLEWQAF